MKKLLTYFGVTLVLMVSVTLKAQTPREFTDLVGEKAAYIDQDMGKRGYMHIKTEKSGYDSYTYWWNDNVGKCVVVRTSDGRIASVADAMALSCNKEDNRGGGNAQDRAYDKGFSDGLYNVSYHNYYSSNVEKEAYSNGYTEGVAERSSRTSHHSGQGGYQPYVATDHLVGKSTDEAFRSLQSGGFVKQNERTQNGRKRVNWYNSRTGQCIKTILDNGRIFKVEKSDGCD